MADMDHITQVLLYARYNWDGKHYNNKIKYTPVLEGQITVIYHMLL